MKSNCITPKNNHIMSKITIAQAESEIFDMLAAENMGDRIYEFAQGLFDKYVNLIECADEVDMDALERDERWYDHAREEFFQTLYDRITKLMMYGEQ